MRKGRKFNFTLCPPDIEDTVRFLEEGVVFSYPVCWHSAGVSSDGQSISPKDHSDEYTDRIESGQGRQGSSMNPGWIETKQQARGFGIDEKQGSGFSNTHLNGNKSRIRSTLISRPYQGQMRKI